MAGFWTAIAGWPTPDTFIPDPGDSMLPDGLACNPVDMLSGKPAGKLIGDTACDWRGKPTGEAGGGCDTTAEAPTSGNWPSERASAASRTSRAASRSSMMSCSSPSCLRTSSASASRAATDACANLKKFICGSCNGLVSTWCPYDILYPIARYQGPLVSMLSLIVITSMSAVNLEENRKLYRECRVQ